MKLTQIDKSVLYILICDWYDTNTMEPTHEIHNWSVIKKTLTSSDTEDGGGHYNMILKHIPTGKFYETSYSDWDMENTSFNENTMTIGQRCDLRGKLVEVVPQEVKTTIYIKV